MPLPFFFPQGDGQSAMPIPSQPAPWFPPQPVANFKPFNPMTPAYSNPGGYEHTPNIGGQTAGAPAVAPMDFTNKSPQEVSDFLLGHLQDSQAFPSAFDQIKDLPVSQLKDVAKEFTGRSTTSGKDALGKIWNRFQNLEINKAKQRATNGRVAG